MNNPTANNDCIVCAGQTVLRQTLSRDFTRQALARFTESDVPPDVDIPAYEMRRCNECSLEFAHPPQPAGDTFYHWLDREDSYYTDDRWEWGEVSEIIARDKPANGACSVLELGAGAGYLLSRLQASGNRVVAIERSQDAVQSLTDQGIDAYTEAQADASLSAETFDFVLAFHCLEHVPDPVGFVSSMCRWAAPRGRVFFSVPYSPMFFESLWFDPLNHPPHHISRWNQQSLIRLAECVGGRALLYMPEALSLATRARLALCVHYQGAHWYRRWRRAWLVPFMHPWHYLKELRHQSRRDQVNGKPASDVVLVEIRQDAS